MAYAGPEYWYVIYKALADFGDLIKDAAAAKAALDALGKSVKEEGAAEVAAAEAASQAREADITSIKDEATSYDALRLAAERANVQTLYGGRSTMEAHLSDLDRELYYRTLLNRAEWLNFTTPQQAYAWRQNEYNQRLLMNRAEWEGYATADQYLGYLSREKASLADINTVMLARAELYKANADAYLAYANAISGTKASFGQLGEGIAGAQAFEAALAGLPAQVTTTLNVEDTASLAAIAAYIAALRGIPTIENTVLSDSQLRGAVPVLPVDVKVSEEGAAQVEAEITTLYNLAQQLLKPVVLEVTEDGTEVVGTKLQQLQNEADALSMLHPTITAIFDDTTAEAEIMKFVASLPKINEVVNISEHVLGEGGAAGGGGGGPPPTIGNADSLIALANYFLGLASAETDASNAARLMYSAQAALTAAAPAQDAALTKTAGVAGTAAKAYGSFASTLFTAGTGWLQLNAKFAVFGGILGTVSAFHLVADAIIELLAILIPVTVALAALSAAVGIFIGVATQAGDTLGRINDRAQAVYTAATALNQAIYPLTNSFSKLQTVIRPEVWELLGDAINVVSGNTGILGKIAEETGAFFDRFAAKVIEDLPSIEKVIGDLVKVGVSDLQRLGVIFLNLGQALLSLVKVTQETHIAEYLLDFLEAASKLIAVLGELPVPLLAIVVGLHAIYLWGGLAVTGVVALLDPLRALAQAAGGVNNAATALANLPKDAAPLDRLKAVLQDIGNGFAAIPGRIGGTTSALDQVAAATGQSVPQLVALQKSAEASGQSIEDLATSTTAGAALVEKWGSNLEGASLDAVNLAVAAGASEAALARISADAAEAGTAASGLGAAFASLGAFLTNPITLIVAAVAAIGVFSLELVRAKDATQTWIQSMDAALSKASVFSAIGQTASDLAAVTQQLANVQHGAAGNASELSAAQSDLSGKLGEELVHVSQVAQEYGTNFVGALALLNAAQVTTSQLQTNQNKVWQEALVQVQGLITGYKAMAIGLGEAQNAITIQLVANASTAPILGAMQKLNGYYDDFLQLSTALAGAFITTGQGANTFATDIKAAGASMTGFNAASLTAQSDAQALLTDVEQQLDAFRNATAVSGTGNITQYVKDLVAELIQAGPHTTAFLAQVTQIADEGGYNGATGSLKALVQWTGNIVNPMDAAQKATNAQVIAVSNLNQDAQQLSSTLEGDLNPAMANATFNAVGGQAAFSKFANDVVKFGPNAQATIQAGKAVADELLSIDKNSTVAQQQFLGWAATLGLTKSQAITLWDTISKGQAPISSLRDNLAKAADATANLGSSGLWGKLRDTFISNMGVIGQSITKGVPDAFIAAGHIVESVWDSTVGKLSAPVTNFFTSTLPHAVMGVPAAVSQIWDDAFQGFMRGFGSPVADWFVTTVPHLWDGLVAPVAHVFDNVKAAITTGFDGWWKTHGIEVEQVWSGVTSFIEHNWDDLWGGLKKTTDVFRSVWDSFIGGLEADWNTLDLKAIIEPIWNGVTDFIAHNWDNVWGGIKSTMDAFRGTWDSFVGGLEGAWGKFTSLFSGGGKSLGNIGSGLSSTFGPVLDTLLREAEGVFKEIGDELAYAFKAAWSIVLALTKITWDTVVLIVNEALDLITGHWGQAWTDMENYGLQVWHAVTQAADQLFGEIETLATQTWNNLFKPVADLFTQYVGTPITDFFSKTLPDSAEQFGTDWLNNVKQLWDYFNTNVVTPIGNFFTKTLPGWFTSFGSTWLNNVKTAWNSFNSTLVTPVGNFFTKTLPGWLGNQATDFANSWVAGWNSFVKNIWNPLAGFFTNTIPGWLGNLGTGFANFWIGVWNNFVKYVWDPILNFFASLPQDIANAIGNIGSSLVNSLKSLLHLAGGGVIPGYAPGQDTRLAAVSPGEGILIPEAVKGIGGPEAIHALNRMFGSYRGAGASPHGQGGYAGGGMVPWTSASGSLPGAHDDAISAFWSYLNARLPASVTPAQEAADFADMIILAAQNNALNAAWQPVYSNLGSPGNLTAGQWNKLFSNLAQFQAWEYGTEPPRSAWGSESNPYWQQIASAQNRESFPKGYTPGTVTPSGWARWHYALPRWQDAQTKTTTFQSIASAAYQAWYSTYGPGASPTKVTSVQATPSAVSVPVSSTATAGLVTNAGTESSGLVPASGTTVSSGPVTSSSGSGVSIAVPDGNGGWQTVTFPSQQAFSNFFNILGGANGYYPTGLTPGQIDGAVQQVGAVVPGGPVTVGVPNGTGGWQTVTFPNQSAFNYFFTSLGGSGGYYPSGLTASQLNGAIAGAGGYIAGTAAGGGAPAPVAPPAATPGPSPSSVNLGPLVLGTGPAMPVQGANPTQGFNTGTPGPAGLKVTMGPIAAAFAGGGTVGLGGGSGLGAVAGMFAMGGVVPTIDLGALGMRSTMASQLGSMSTLPRTMGDAANAGPLIGEVNINNPLPERPSDSIARATNRLAFMANRGVA